MSMRLLASSFAAGTDDFQRHAGTRQVARKGTSAYFIIARNAATKQSLLRI